LVPAAMTAASGKQFPPSPLGVAKGAFNIAGPAVERRIQGG
jgi:hypothetical protein